MTDPYFASEGANWSLLKHLDDSPLAYKHAKENPRPDTADLALGLVVHTLVFEPHKFGDEYAVFHGSVRRGKDWDAFEAENTGKTIFKAEELAKARAIAAAVRAHPIVAPYLIGGEFERVLRWVDPVTGIKCKAKADWLIPGRRILADLKTTRSIERRRFAADVARYGYYGQLAHYSAGVTHALGWTPIRRILIAVEKDAPHDVAVYELDAVACEVGDEKAAELLAKLKACMDLGDWPGRYTEEQTLELPGWVFGADDLEMTLDMET